jgi:hypothetical protein
MNTTTHPFAPEEIMAFVDGELSADRAQSISSHIDQCTECQEVAKSVRLTSQKMAGWSVDAPQRLSEGISRLGAEAIASIGRPGGGFSRLRDILSRRSVWAPTLALALAVIAFVTVIPNMFVMHRAQSAMTSSAMHKSAMQLDMEPYHSGPARVNGGGGADKPVVQSRDNPKLLEGSFAVTPMIARVVSLTIVVKDFDDTRQSLDAILARHNGYAAELNAATPQSSARTIQASLRIPANQLVAALAELKALGRVENETQNGEEVTQQHADLVARLKNSRETEQRLQDVLRTRTGKVKDVLEVEEEIARVRGEIEQMEAEQQTLEHRVNFATIDLKLAEEYRAQLSSPAPSVGMQLRNATVNGFSTASESVLAIILFFAESGPTFLLWLMILLLPARMLRRRYRRALAVGSSFGG